MSSACHAVSEESCSAVDHRHRLPPVRDQLKTEWCYAFTAADLLSFEAGQPISAIGVGIQTQRDYRAAVLSLPNIDASTKAKLALQNIGTELTEGTYNFNRGGDVEMALVSNMHLAPSLCIEDDLPHKEFSLVLAGKPQGLQTQSGLDTLRDLVRTKRPEDRGILPAHAELCNEQDSLASFLFPAVKVSDFRNVVSTIRQNTDPLGELYELACQRRVHISKNLKAVKVRKTDDGTVLMQALDQQLDRSPAAISYNIASLKNPELVSESSNHASSIVARRLNPESGQCEYLLRNSWGARCNPGDYHSSLKCEDGNIWIPASTLKKMLFNFTGIQEEP